MGEIEFDEEKAYVSRVKRQKSIPEKGIEGFVYNKMPGKYSYKRNMLIVVIISIFVIAFIFFILAIQNLGEIPDQSFNERIIKTQAK